MTYQEYTSANSGFTVPREVALAYLESLLGPALSALRAKFFPDDTNHRPVAPAKHRRAPTLASVAKQARKADIAVARYEVKPDGTVVVVTGQPEPPSPDNPWLADLSEATKQ
jgi:hypothetical protein